MREGWTGMGEKGKEGEEEDCKKEVQKKEEWKEGYRMRKRKRRTGGGRRELRKDGRERVGEGREGKEEVQTE